MGAFILQILMRLRPLDHKGQEQLKHLIYPLFCIFFIKIYISLFYFMKSFN